MKKTNKYIKHIKRLGIMIVTMLLSFTIATQNVHAVEHTDIDEIIIPTITYINHGIGGLGDIDLNPGINDVTNELENTSYQGIKLYIVSPNRLFSFQYSINDVTYTYNNISRYEIIFDWRATSSNRIYTINLYNSSNVLIKSETAYYSQIEFMSSTYVINTSTYENGLYEGFISGYDSARDQYGLFFDGIWYTAEQWGDILYERGLEAEQSEAYDEGYRKGSNDSFMASIKDWIVPAIIVVLFLGGALTIIAKKREG